MRPPTPRIGVCILFYGARPACYSVACLSMRQPRPTPHVRTPSHVRARAMCPPRPLGSIPWVEPACGGAGVGRGGGGYAPGCLATPRSLLATVDFLAGSAADRGGGRGGIGMIFAGDRRRAVHDATPDGSASGISRDRLDGIRYLGYSRDAGPMTGPWGDQCADMRGAFHVPPPSCFAHPLAIRAPVDQCLEYSS